MTRLPRKTSESERLALKVATRHLVDACGGGINAASITRVGQQKLSDYGNRNVADVFAGIDVIADLERDCGELFVTRALADLAACDVVPRPGSAAPLAPADILARMIRESADVSAAIATAQAAGGWTREMRAKIRKEILDLYDVLAPLKAEMEVE
ncbi:MULTISPECIES: hypothetical protein [unclassified Chelatococcus]|uniref:hypothetical protein n=1 Tax=unclassified Chelatococcus TaxID=2638111 RepID=UPI001BD150FF|nr:MULTISPECIES: hypothetical protein [unclassified Chelatococcus]CAH1670606.1 conserved hypothetical protein [Hyphomicrobiales bacterium]MBS7738357.1 hypothetical protein [Chelatococcus sp. HY11]MBX3545885.1 hypothetical protein [Chelatococcus sp.]MCO5077297.1 hypothetical protein [Chelatococcus sp.]CAH1677161.1 conserved hypothetical protein [Hyphomicrobiales bacterium]